MWHDVIHILRIAIKISVLDAKLTEILQSHLDSAAYDYPIACEDILENMGKQCWFKTTTKFKLQQIVNYAYIILGA